MQLLKDRIRKDGVIKDGNVLKVDSFLNHQMDIALINEMGKEFRRRFPDESINKILTIEASGIGIACLTAQYFNCPVVFAKKTQSINIDGEVYSTQIKSFTHGRTYDVIVKKAFLSPEDNILIIDDFLANWLCAARAYRHRKARRRKDSRSRYRHREGRQKGGELVRSQGIRVESLAIIDEMDPVKGCKFRDDD